MAKAKKKKKLVKKVKIGSTLYTPEEGKLPPTKEHENLIARGFIVEGDDEAIENAKNDLQSNTTIIAELNKDEKIELGTSTKSNSELASAMKVEDKVDETTEVDLTKVITTDGE